MKKLICSLVLGISIAWNGMVAAAPLEYNFYDLQGGFVSDSAISDSNFTWTFNLDSGLYFSEWNGVSDPDGPLVNINPEDRITKAFLEISFYDGDNYVDPYVNPDTSLEKPAYRETVKIIVEGENLIVNDTGIREIDTEVFKRNNVVRFLTDHILTLTITAISGDFEVQSVLLGGTFKDLGAANNPVPEPATLLLFATGMAGLAAVGRGKTTRRRETSCNEDDSSLIQTGGGQHEVA